MGRYYKEGKTHNSLKIGTGVSNVEKVLHKFARAADIPVKDAVRAYDGDEAGISEKKLQIFWNAIDRAPGKRHGVDAKIEEARKLDSELSI